MAVQSSKIVYWPVGLMDKASASGAGHSRFESWAGHVFARKLASIPPRKPEVAWFEDNFFIRISMKMFLG